MPKSLCNHELFIMCCCCHWCHCHLWTVLLVVGLIIGTYLAHIWHLCPWLCTWNIRSVWHVICKWQPFFFFLTLTSPAYMVKYMVNQRLLVSVKFFFSCLQTPVCMWCHKRHDVTSTLIAIQWDSLCTKLSISEK